MVRSDVPEVWLLYSNGNHYDALIKKDNPLLTIGPIQENPVWHLEEEPLIRDTNKYKPLKESEEKKTKTCDKTEKDVDTVSSLKEKLRKSELTVKEICSIYSKAENTIVNRNQKTPL